MPTSSLERNGNLSSMDGFNDLLKSNLIYNRAELSWYEKFNRFGFMDPYNNLSQSKEYLFFTKPDCHIFTPNTTTLQPELKNNPFFIDMANRYPHVLQQLQSSAGSVNGSAEDNITRNPFMVLLSNSVKNSIDLPSLTANEMDNSTNLYGTTLPYRKDAWTGDENIEFNLEFEDSRFLEVYLLLKAYEEYERYKTIGLIYPPNISGAPEFGEAKHNANSYITEKRLHDVFGIYRIIVGEDYETIIYWAYLCGCYFTTVPRDAFNDLKNGEGLNFSVGFKAFCVSDMDPTVLVNFNRLIYKSYGKSAANRSRLYIYGKESSDDYTNLKKETHERINGDWAKYPLIAKRYRSEYITTDAWPGTPEMGYTYQLQWFS